MSTVSDRLRDADPISREPHPGEGERNRARRAMADAASRDRARRPAWTRTPTALLAAAALTVAVLVAAGWWAGSGGGATVYAAVRFEVRLAEDSPAAGLREVRMPGSDRVIYLHEEAVVTNADIDAASVTPGNSPSRFNIGVQFNAAGAEKMRRATAGHIGKPMAVLLDGEVVMAPTLRSAIGESALITGDYSRAEADRIVNGISVR